MNLEFSFKFDERYIRFLTRIQTEERARIMAVRMAWGYYWSRPCFLMRRVVVPFIPRVAELNL